MVSVFAGRRSFLMLMGIVLAALLALSLLPQAHATNGKVLILDSTVSGGAGSVEAVKATALGRGVDVVNAATWGGMTTAQFADYDALILGDATCGGSAAAAEANAATWGAAVTGNVVIVGTDPVFHDGQGGNLMTEKGVAFAVDSAGTGKTGAYITLSCYYHGTAPGTPVPLLSALSTFGGFTVTGVGCYNDAHIVATHPAITGLTDASVSNWSCSVHEAFDSFPSDFLPLIIARDPAGGPALPGSLPFPDGSSGVPYVMARGEGLVLISNITLSPLSATNPVGTSHTVTATVKEDDVPIAGATVTFTVTGANTASGTGVTNASGEATFTYTGTNEGTDTIVASYVDSAGATRTSNNATKVWEKPADSTPPTASCVATTNPAGATVPVAGKNPRSGMNPDGFYQIFGSDETALGSIVIRDGASSFVSDPFASGDKVKITQNPTATPSDTRPGPLGIVSHLILNGDAILRVTDAAGNVTEVTCYVPPLPK